MNWKEKQKTYIHFDFDLARIKAYLRECENLEEVTRYVDWIRKEASQDVEPFSQVWGFSNEFFSRIDTEYLYWNSFYKPELDEQARIFEERQFLKEVNEFQQVQASLQASLQAKEETPQQATQKPKNLEPIQWEGSEPQLVYLFELLFEQGLISNENRSALIAKHFVNSTGKPFNNKQLNTVKGKYELNKYGKPQDAAKIENVVQKLKEK
jgi:hypothetical protein